MLIEAHCRDEIYQIKQPLHIKDTMLKLYDFSLHHIVENLEMRDGVLFLYLPETVYSKVNVK